MFLGLKLIIVIPIRNTYILSIELEASLIMFLLW